MNPQATPIRFGRIVLISVATLLLISSFGDQIFEPPDSRQSVPLDIPRASHDLEVVIDGDQSQLHFASPAAEREGVQRGPGPHDQLFVETILKFQEIMGQLPSHQDYKFGFYLFKESSERGGPCITMRVTSANEISRGAYFEPPRNVMSQTLAESFLAQAHVSIREISEAERQ